MATVSIVVIPARNEEDRIAACISALAAQTVTTDAFEVILVADACTDRTEAVACARAAEVGVSITVLRGPGAGTGPARRLGMDAAAERLEQLALPQGLIATTDADTEPACDWLERQLAHLDSGAEAIGGLIELDPGDTGQLPDEVWLRREADAERRLRSVRRSDPGAAHHHFAGASLGISAETYRRVGGIEPAPALEDEFFAERLRRHDVRVLRPADVRVRTAARTEGRAQRGLSVDLAVSSWLARRRFRAEQFDIGRLRELKGSTNVSVVIPTKDCEDTIGAVLEQTVGPARVAGLVDELIVIDGSRDATAARAVAGGARVVQESEVLPEFGPSLGKGDAMWRALAVTSGSIVCFLDGDTGDPDPRHLLGLLGPLFAEPTIMLVKGSFARPFRSGGTTSVDEGGRVTELAARPLLNLHFPLLSGFQQPLAGEFGARRALLEGLPFPTGYGVEIATLIDSLREYGLDALAESDLGERQNRHQPLRSLGEMAFAVMIAVERRLEGRTSSSGGQYLRPWQDGAIIRVPVGERPALATLRPALDAVVSC
ncbi:MAG TPA: glucosyl-3-phosphoglycerate synthase [Solirubrobacteraceae bacterium]|nr:glucosyl-3-phosphoglycerate synthase [Solirubrobacteraceae bacterium]